MNISKMKIGKEHILSIHEIFDIDDNRNFDIFAGPCAIESQEQMESIAENLVSNGVKFLRAGAYKPRTSPYDFQGLGMEGLHILNNIKAAYGLKIITELVSLKYLDEIYQTADIIQIGARNMYNYEMLKEVGKIDKPILLKRGISATIEEFLYAAEYVFLYGNYNIILCERGIRTFETQTRNTLDISCPALIKEYSNIPIIVDLSHSLGRKDILLRVCRAIKSLGVDGFMVEVHPRPKEALSDSRQQLSFKEFNNLVQQIYDI